MTALAQTSPIYMHPWGRATRRVFPRILRGKKIYHGAIVAMHNGRMMPAGSFDNANSINDGGPLSIAGADGNAGLRVICTQPNTRFAIITGGTVPVVTVLFSTNVDITVTCANTTTAAAIVAALDAHPIARARLDYNFTGTGAGVAGQQAMAAPPYVTLGGIAKDTYDNSDDTLADLTITDRIIDLDTGIVLVANDATDPATISDVGGDVCILDDQTIARTVKRLHLSGLLFDFTTKDSAATSLPWVTIR